MKGYFEQIIGNLSIDEMAILGILIDKEATAAFKAIKRHELYQLSGLSMANFRKNMEKLAATQLIQVVAGGKEHKVFLTGFGNKAVEKSLEEAGFE